MKISGLEKFIMNLSDGSWTLRMYKYFTGNGSLIDNLDKDEITIFDEPMSLADVPKMLHKYYNTDEDQRIAGKLQTIDKINRNFNNSEREEAGPYRP